MYICIYYICIHKFVQSVNDGWLTMASGLKTEVRSTRMGQAVGPVDTVDPNVAKAMIDLIDHPQFCQK
jgi:hypothetical protein